MYRRMWHTSELTNNKSVDNKKNKTIFWFQHITLLHLLKCLSMYMNGRCSVYSGGNKLWHVCA